ncbi:MAG TPA: phage tail protein, partial [Bdellovibrionota bacterium]|nr:phage tail protein [Bdellovibrionota bacterium]
MKKRTLVAVTAVASAGAATLLMGAVAVSHELGFDFIAPTVVTTASAPTEQGLIVYDASADAFRGRGASDWQSLTAGGGADVPAGTILPFAGPGSQVPTGYLLCDGGAYNAANYPVLYGVIGEIWGNAGDSDPATFNVPDLRGMFMRGLDNMGTAAGAAGVDPGRVLGSNQADAFQ